VTQVGTAIARAPADFEVAVAARRLLGGCVMRSIVTSVFFAGLTFVAACGGVATDSQPGPGPAPTSTVPGATPPAQCGASTCGACGPGTSADDRCENGKWKCACVPTSTCAAAPACDPGDKAVSSQQDCPVDMNCYSRSICNSTIWCGHETDVVWPADASKLTAVDSGGGLVPQPPPGSKCVLSQATFTYAPSTRKLDWSVCDSSVSPYALKTGSRALSSTEGSQVDAAMKAVTPAQNNNQCGTDKPELHIEVSSPTRGTKTFYDSFYACQQKGAYVDNLDPLLYVLGTLAH
jgi:hypothetical protein